MTYKEIIEQEKNNYDRIILRPEGMFLKAYEKSAFGAYTCWGPFKISKKEVKCVGMDVVSVGFPISGLEKRIDGYDRQELEDGRIEVRLHKQMNEEDFIKWKSTIE